MKVETQIFKALSDETRLRIMILLTHGELCVCDIEKILETTQSKISRHLSYLKNSGLVNDTRRGIWVYYSISDTKNIVQQSIINCLKNCFNQNELVKLDYQKLQNCLKEKQDSNC